jgi:hypothetical protein
MLFRKALEGELKEKLARAGGQQQVDATRIVAIGSGVYMILVVEILDNERSERLTPFVHEVARVRSHRCDRGSIGRRRS